MELVGTTALEPNGHARMCGDSLEIAHMRAPVNAADSFDESITGIARWANDEMPICEERALFAVFAFHAV